MGEICVLCGRKSGEHQFECPCIEETKLMETNYSKPIKKAFPYCKIEYKYSYATVFFCLGNDIISEPVDYDYIDENNDYLQHVKNSITRHIENHIFKQFINKNKKQIIQCQFLEENQLMVHPKRYNEIKKREMNNNGFTLEEDKE